MIISVDGANGSGKSDIVEKIFDRINYSKQEGELEEQTTVIRHFSGKDENFGMGFMDDFMSNIESNNLMIFDGSWFSETCYGSALKDNRPFSIDPFLSSFFYSRVLNGRGVECLIVPSNINDLPPKGSFEVSPTLQNNWFRRNVGLANLEIFVNDFGEIGMNKFVAKICRKLLKDSHNKHKLPVAKYVGPIQPTILFVGSEKDVSGVFEIPFQNSECVEFFRPFKNQAISKFGYTTVDNYEYIPDYMKEKVITIGEYARSKIGESYNVSFGRGSSDKRSVRRFVNQVNDGIEMFGARI